MKPFRATYTPVRLNTREGDIEHGIDFSLHTVPDTDKARPVLIIDVSPSLKGNGAVAIFIDSDASLREDSLYCFTNCQMGRLNA